MTPAVLVLLLVAVAVPAYFGWRKAGAVGALLVAPASFAAFLVVSIGLTRLIAGPSEPADCGNSDCDGCCTQNSHHGFLVDMEYWTTERRIGGPDNADGTIQFKILN